MTIIIFLGALLGVTYKIYEIFLLGMSPRILIRFFLKMSLAEVCEIREVIFLKFTWIPNIHLEVFIRII